MKAVPSGVAYHSIMAFSTLIPYMNNATTENRFESGPFWREVRVKNSKNTIDYDLRVRYRKNVETIGKKRLKRKTEKNIGIIILIKIFK